MDNDDVERELDELEKRMAHYKIKREPEALIYWRYYKDGRVETNFTPSDKPKITQETPLDEQVIEPPKPRWQSSCKRCGYTWMRRAYKLPIQCPKCKSPYWNRKRVKRG
jgi:rubrerythrin